MGGKELSSAAVLAEVEALLKAALDEEAACRASIDTVLPRHRASAVNLAHYLALRARDVRKLQLALAGLGLSSLGRCEGHVLDTLQRISGWLSSKPLPEGTLGRSKAESLLHDNTRALLGPKPADRHVYIMVTSPDAADATQAWADDLLQAGTDVLRINGAHEGPEQWKQVATLFKERAAALGKSARVLVDLPGPKLRAEIRQLEEAVLHLPRRKDRLGRTVAPTELLLVEHYSAEGQLPVPAAWLKEMKTGDEVTFIDAGGRERALVVRGKVQGGVAAHCARSLYLLGGLKVAWCRAGKILGEGRLGELPKEPRELHLTAGDRLVVNSTGLSPDPALPVLALAEPALLAQVRPGERVVLDDGRVTAVVESAVGDTLECKVQRTHRESA
ncbi:MAG: hypothetical protein ACM30H_14765, partial [Clostridia bacterium]